MTLAVLALAVLAAAADQAPAIVVPNSPDLSITTRFTVDGGRRQTITVRLKGARSRQDLILDGGSDPAITFPPQISQCDLGRRLILNPHQSTYAYTVIETPPAAADARWRAALSSTAGAPRSVAVATIDTVDTGERRQIGGLAARHVITTQKVTKPEQTAPESTRVLDGWYADLPPTGCVDWGERGMLALGGVIRRGSEPAATVMRVVYLGRAKRGYALIETDRLVEGDTTMTRTTEVVEISHAPLDASLFEVPPGYRAALPTLGGGFDLSRPDTFGNRLATWWDGLRSFVYRFWP